MHSAIPRIPFTQEAYDKMQAEHDALLIEEKAVIVRVQIAREMGDLSENGAYKYGKMQLGDTRRRLKELKYLLSRGQVIKPKSGSQIIQFGSTVVLKTDNKTMTYMLVSAHESDPMQGKISFKSPLGAALVGKKVGNTVVVELPAKTMEYVVVEVR